MDSTLKQRLIGAAVLAALAIIFLPMLLKGPDVKEPDAAEVPLSMPATPGQDFETRELPLTTPDAATPPGGVLGMAPGSTPPSAPGNGIAESNVADAGPAEGTDVAVALPKPDSAAVAQTPLPPAEAAQVGAGGQVVNVGTYANVGNANALSAKLRAAGLPVVAERVSLASGSAVRLRVGPYATRAAAEAARLRADQATGTASTVIVLDATADASASVKTPAPIAAATPAKAPTASLPSTPVPAPAKSSVASSGFAVQLSAPSVEADAMALRDKARAAGFSAFVQRIESATGTRFRVRVGPVADRSAANLLLAEVKSKMGTGGLVVANP